MDFQDVKDNSGTVAAALAVIGVGLTAYLSGRAAIKAKDIPVPEDKKGRFKRFVNVYLTPVLSGLGTCALIVASDRIHHSKEVALGSVAASALAISDDYIRFERAAREEMGDERTAQIHARVREEQKEYLTDNHILVYEPYTDQYIWTTRETIAWALLQLNRELVIHLDVRLSYFIRLLNGKHKSRGDELGWDWENSDQLEQWQHECGPWVDIAPELHNDGPRKCLWLYYSVEPEELDPSGMIYNKWT